MDANTRVRARRKTRKYLGIFNVAIVKHLLPLNKLRILCFIFGSAEFWTLVTLKIPIRYFLVVLRANSRPIACNRSYSVYNILITYSESTLHDYDL